MSEILRWNRVLKNAPLNSKMLVKGVFYGMHRGAKGMYCYANAPRAQSLQANSDLHTIETMSTTKQGGIQNESNVKRWF